MQRKANKARKNKPTRKQGLTRITPIPRVFPEIMPRVHDCALRYVEGIDFTTASGVISNYTFALNDLYDPNVTGTGHQPKGFDQLAALYFRYKVLSVHVKVTVTNTLATTAVDWVMLPAQVSTSFSTIEGAYEEPGASFMTVGRADSGQSSLVMEKEFYLPAIVGRTPESWMADDLVGAFVSASPSNIVYLRIATQTQESVTASTHARFELKYRCRFFERSATVAGS
jgi:hypothetical protein